MELFKIFLNIAYGRRLLQTVTHKIMILLNILKLIKNEDLTCCHVKRGRHDDTLRIGSLRSINGWICHGFSGLINIKKK